MRLLVCVVALVLCLAPSAIARPEPRKLGPTPPSVSSDGVRLAVWSDNSTDDTPVRVVDTLERRSFLVDPPESCFYTAVGGAQLLFQCEAEPGPNPGCESRFLPLLYSVDHDKFHWPAHVDELYGRQGEYTGIGTCYSVRFDAVGRHWIGFTEFQGKTDEQFLYEWHDGQSTSEEAKEHRRRVIDLDEPDALETLCRPLERPENPSYTPGYPGDRPFLGYAYFEPFGMWQDSSGIHLQRCDSRKQRRLAPPEYLSGLTPRVAYWAEEYKLHVLVLRSGRRLVYDFSYGRSEWDYNVGVVATTRRLYVTVTEPKPPYQAGTAYVLRTPRR